MKKIIVWLLSVTFAFCFVTSASAASVYTVQNGDSLWSISKKYNVPFTELLKLNTQIKNPNLIYPNEQINLPNGTGVSTNQNSSTDNIQNGNNQSVENATSDQAKAVLKLVNEERAKQGLKPLTLSMNLTSIATTKSKDMAVNKYFSHQSPTYGSPFQMLQSFGVSYKSAGENIAAGQRTSNEVMQAWLNSSGHRANILNANYTELGVGYYKGGSYGVYWTQLFVGK